MNNKCKRRGCNKICQLPSWKYCSDECCRLENNRKATEKNHLKFVKNKSK